MAFEKKQYALKFDNFSPRLWNLLSQGTKNAIHVIFTSKLSVFSALLLILKPKQLLLLTLKRFAAKYISCQRSWFYIDSCTQKTGYQK